MMLLHMQTITRRREAPGSYVAGEWAAGAITETALAASVQPLVLEDSDFVGGAQLSDRRKVFVEGASALVAAFDGANADLVVIDHEVFVVEESMSWPDHTEAVVLRET